MRVNRGLGVTWQLHDLHSSPHCSFRHLKHHNIDGGVLRSESCSCRNRTPQKCCFWPHRCRLHAVFFTYTRKKLPVVVLRSQTHAGLISEVLFDYVKICSRNYVRKAQQTSVRAGSAFSDYFLPLFL